MNDRNKVQKMVIREDCGVLFVHKDIMTQQTTRVLDTLLPILLLKLGLDTKSFSNDYIYRLALHGVPRK